MLTKRSEIWLSLDLASNPGSIALHRVVNETAHLLSEQMIGDKWKQSEQIYPILQQTLLNASIPIQIIDRYLTIEGPGSFTGLRLGLSVLKAFSLATGNPIETQSASEVRAIYFLDQNPDSVRPFHRLDVVTFATARKWVCASWIRSGSSWVFEKEEVRECPVLFNSTDTYVLFDDQAKPEEWPEQSDGKRMTIFPMKASYLASTLLKSTTRKTHQTIENVIALSPKYFASAELKRVPASLLPTPVHPNSQP